MGVLNDDQRRRITSVLGIAAVALAGGGLAGVAMASSPNAPRNFEVVAVFNDAGAILKGSNVKSHGVTVGSVRKIELVGGKARLTLALNGEVAPLHEDAKATIRPMTLLGERFVDLDQGSPSSPVLGAGAVIPPSQTGRSVDLDEVLGAVDNPTGTALAATLAALGEGTAGRGADVQAALKALAPALQDTKPLLDLLNDQNRLLTSLADRVAPVAQALGGDRGVKLDKVVAGATNVLQATSASSQALADTMSRLPAALTSAQAALAEVAATAGQATPVLADLRPLTGDLRTIAKELSGFASAASPALNSLNPVIEQAGTLLAAARPAVSELSAAGPDLAATSTALAPMVRQLDTDLSQVLAFFRNVALETNGYDAISHYIRAQFTVNPDDFTGALPTKAPQLPFLNGGPKVDVPKLKVPQVLPSMELPTVPLPELVLSGKPGLDGSATGLTAQQEQSLLSFLLGSRGGR